MRINPMNTMSFQAKIRPGKQSVATSNYRTLEQCDLTPAFTTQNTLSTTGSSFSSGNPISINTIEPNFAEQIAQHPLLAGAFSTGMAMSTGLMDPSEGHIKFPIKDPSETLTKDDINIEEK